MTEQNTPSFRIRLSDNIELASRYCGYGKEGVANGDLKRAYIEAGYNVLNEEDNEVIIFDGADLKDDGVEANPDLFDALLRYGKGPMMVDPANLWGNLLHGKGDHSFTFTRFTRNDEINNFMIDNPDLAQSVSYAYWEGHKDAKQG